MLIKIITWWFALQIIGFAILPISSKVCQNLKDKGYSISKPFGLLIITYLSWLFGISVLVSLIIVVLCSILIYKKYQLSFPDKKYILKFEALFFVSFFIFSIIRAYSPEIYWTGGEKFMDMTFINSFLRTHEFPPSDPWMSGTPIQYYYFGYLIVANIIQLTQITPSIAFNLADASFFALSLTSAYGIGYSLTGKIKYGFMCGFFVIIAGNIMGFIQLIEILFFEKTEFNYWTASRIIPNTINEFPFFSFLHGDVHAHAISIVFQIVILILLLNILNSKKLEVISLFALSLAIGFLYPLNTWDYPLYIFLAVCVIVARYFILEKKDKFVTILSICSVLILSYLLYLPYHNSYKLERTLSIVTYGRTEILYYLGVWILFLYFLYSFVMKNSNLKPIYFILSIVVLSVFSILLKFEILIIVVPLIILSILKLLKEKDTNSLFILILIISGGLLSLFCELFYIPDSLGKSSQEYIRLNTVFKIYLQNWILWGIASSYVLYNFRTEFSEKKLWAYVGIVVILVASVYPIFATISKSGDFKSEPTLNGMDYVKKEHPQEYIAILWFQNISGKPVVLQASGELYNWNTYITTFTGLPTVIGWGGHEANWRMDSEDVNIRWNDVNKIYTSTDINEVDMLLKKYNVTYIYFGEVETKRYNSPKLFETHQDRFEKVFEYGDILVYRVKF